MLVNAGHPSPLIYRRATCTVEEAISFEATGLLLGINGFERMSCQVSLEAGECLLAFTVHLGLESQEHRIPSAINKA
jgi:serine phosphatase RsbU (regulator of sigma subunit)